VVLVEEELSMKKWQRMTLSFGLASSLLVPSFSSASVQPDLKVLKEKAQADWLKNFKGSSSEQRLLAIQKQEQEKQVSSDTIIVKYETKLAASVHRKSGAKLERSIPSLGYDIVKLSKGQKLADLLTFYSKQPGVTSVTPSVTYKSLATGDPKKAGMYHLNYIDIDNALELAGEHEVTVAVIDTGMDIKHLELKNQVLPPYSVMNPAGQPILDIHGTHVAGIIAAEQDNGIGGHGVNPNAKILPIDVFSGGFYTSDYTIAEGILYAISKNVDVINMSLGGSQESPILAEAVKKAIDAGITIVAAAGNNYGESISYPAAYEGVISVSATNHKDELAEFSSYGSFVDIAAPGEAVYNSLYDPYKGSSFGYLSGTSMASPVVAGVASLLLSKYPDLKPFEVEAILKMTAWDLGEEGYDIKFGAGFVDAVAALEFDMKKLPKAPEVTEADAKAKAPEVTGDKASFQKAILTAGETHWYKLKLEKGEGAQALLDGAKQFNYKMLFDFVPDSAEGKSESRSVNQAPNGKQEGGFFQAKESGTLYVGVKDVYGHYDLASRYSLSLTKEKVMKIDHVTATEPVEISKLPFNSADGGTTLTFGVDAEATEADKDYFRFTVTEPTTVKFDLSAVPGIDSSVGVYFEPDFFMPAPPDLPPGAYWEKPMIQYVNNAGIGEGEKLSFDALPGMNYLIEVSAEPKRDFWYEMMFGTVATKTAPIPNSNTPYTLKAEKVVAAPDEDGFPMREQRPEEQVTKGEMTVGEYQATKRKEFQEAMDKMAEQPYYRYFDENLLNLVKEKAVPYTLGNKLEGKYQFSGDEDYYKFTADADAIYKFELAEPKDILPWVQVMEYDPKMNDMYPIADIWTYGILWGEEVDLSRSVALEKGKEYYIRFMNERYQASDEPYVLTTSKLIDVPGTKDTDQNKDIFAMSLAPGKKAKNDLVYTTDTDYYYYKNKDKEDFLSLTVQPLPFELSETEDVPEELMNPLIAFVNIIEDTNGNMKVDGDEALTAVPWNPNQMTLSTEASFKAKKDVGYFFAVNGFGLEGGVSIQPYEIGLHHWNNVDEDKTSVVKNNVPSKPLALKNLGAGSNFAADGYFNPGVNFGDRDYYKLTVDKYSKFEVRLATPYHLDGVISIYDAKGKKVARMDHYGMGDFEVGTVTLPKGNYYIMIEESFGQTSLEGYTLSVKKK
jgi:serine protease